MRRAKAHSLGWFGWGWETFVFQPGILSERLLECVEGTEEDEAADDDGSGTPEVDWRKHKCYVQNTISV